MSVLRELNGMHPLPPESISALRKLLENAIDAIDLGLVKDAGDCGLLSYSLKAIVVGSRNVSADDSDKIQGAGKDFDDCTLLDVEEESAKALMGQLFGFEWQRHTWSLDSFRPGMVYDSLLSAMRQDGKKFIKRTKAAS